MTGLEIVLVIAGIVLMVGSFLITEKISPAELNKMAELSEKEIRGILDRELSKSKDRIDESIDAAIEESIEKVERSLDKETNEKIMAINEYSDTVLNQMNKTHEEIMFLYSMLNDRHVELTEMSKKLVELVKRLEEKRKEQEIFLQAEETAEFKLRESRELHEIKEVHETKEMPETDPAEVVEEVAEPQEEYTELINHNAEILTLYREGRKTVEIAKELGLSVGEVRLVLDLYKEVEHS